MMEGHLWGPHPNPLLHPSPAAAPQTTPRHSAVVKQECYTIQIQQGGTSKVATELVIWSVSSASVEQGAVKDYLSVFL